MVNLVRWAAVLLFLAGSGDTYAFGLKTHLWTGRRLLAEIRSSCRVNVGGVPTPIDAGVCESIRSHPEAFLSGVLGPDAYPDVITGQVTTHPGIAGDWQTNDWLMHIYSQATPGPELAFAAGYLVHAAGDVFAHTYVNSYSGDVFSLEGERRVELRHFLLEKYIDSRLPDYTYSAGMLGPPAEYLRDKLIHNPDASRLATASGISLHITAMHDVHRNVGDVARELDRIEGEAASLVARLIADIGDNSVKIISGEAQLKLLRETLSANELRLKLQQEVFDRANDAFNQASSALEDNIRQIHALAQQAAAARQAAELAQQAGTDANQQILSLQEKVVDLKQFLDGVPTHITREICRDEVVNTVCNLICPWCGSACSNVVRRVCDAVQEVNAQWDRLNAELNDATRELVRQEARAAQAIIDATTHLAIETAKLQEKATLEGLIAGLETARAVTKATLDLNRTLLEAEMTATQAARKAVDDVAAEIERLRRQIIDWNSIKSTLEDLIARSDVLSFLVKNWVRGMDIAGKEFILASDRVSKGMLEGRSNFVSTYLDWWKCSGQAYAAVPVQFGQAVCTVEDFMNKFDEEVSKIIQQVLPPPFDKVYADYLNFRLVFKQELKDQVNRASIELLKLVSPDATTSQFLEVLLLPDAASQGGMNDAFATAADSGKPLLTFDRVSDLIDADIGLRGDKLDPEKFVALKNALALSRLLLMDMDGVKGLAWVLGADAGAIGTPTAPGRTSLVFDMVRSIDGNHQWQPFGLPYPSANGAAPRPQNPHERSYGYGPTQARPGFLLFIDEKLRQAMFLRIFEGPIAPGLAKHLASYPFKECVRHPFAVAFAPNGTGADGDDGCTSNTSPLPGRTRWEWWRRFVNWLRLNPFR